MQILQTTRPTKVLIALGMGLAACADDKPHGVESADGIGDVTSGDVETAGGGLDGATGGADGSEPAQALDEEEGDPDPGDGDGEPVKFDTIAVPDGGPACSIGEGVDVEFSYLWAANSSEGTISKIDTKTVTEVGRYLVRADGAGSPSRTSVSLSGNVAVANRNGGITKVYANESDCVDSNGIPGIQTSHDSTYLPWLLEECVAWHKPMDYNSQRPVAWGPAVFNPSECAWEGEELWTAGTNQNGKIDFFVLDGEDGSTKEAIAVPTGIAGLAADFFGIYGGAVDGHGNFWGSQLGTNGRLIRVNREDMTYEIWSTPPGPHWYGMTVDSDGMVWLCSATVGRFDPTTETWATAAVGGWTGCMADAGDNGLLWMANGNGVIGVNRDTLVVEKEWPAAGSYGISIDFEGYVWAVANGSNVSKIDPDTGDYQVYGGLVGAYTYSDMTGYALSNAGKPSG
jgi:DNA-binding beta-propeller fold protein YncE